MERFPKNQRLAQMTLPERIFEDMLRRTAEGEFKTNERKRPAELGTEYDTSPYTGIAVLRYLANWGVLGVVRGHKRHRALSGNSIKYFYFDEDARKHAEESLIQIYQTELEALARCAEKLPLSVRRQIARIMRETAQHLNRKKIVEIEESKPDEPDL